MANAGYETVVGLEVHCQLLTRTKIFCGCHNRFGDPPNTNVCPVCLGLPGALPVLNRAAVELALRAAVALHCTVQPRSEFARKNYFYPDLPKGYQISQYDQPLAVDGWLDLPGPSGRRARIQRIHMEEDAGKLVHDNLPWSGPQSGVDLNRAGVPLIEIVAHPDLRSGEEASAYLSSLREILVYAGVSDCNMEEGSLRCDANVSIRPLGSTGLGTRAEVKNLNSFRNVARAVEHEAARQAALLASGGQVVQETRLFDADRGETRPMRSKEDAQDYRYFPEPDLPPLVIGEAWVEEVRRALPELPDAKRRRFMEEYGLPAYDASVLTQDGAVADYFEAVARASGQPKAASNRVMGDVLRKLNEEGRTVADAPVSAERLADLVRLVAAGTISGTTAKDVFDRIWSTGAAAAEIVAREGLEQVSDEGALQDTVRELVALHPAEVETYRKGKTSTLGWFVGQVMKRTGGKANPQLVSRLLREALERPERKD
jgi:aspartyl-tRNA(Asn)/glutamyl-tRNA(Gln) amidotransferase subunit B